MWPYYNLGKRRLFVVTLLGQKGMYPRLRLRSRDSLFVGESGLVSTAVPSEPPNEAGFSEVGWADVGQVRFWGAIGFAIRDREGFRAFYPIGCGSICSETLREVFAERVALRLKADAEPQEHGLWRRDAREAEIHALYGALLAADNVLLRGVNCYLKSHLFWKEPLLSEERGINLYIALEAGLATLRKRLSTKHVTASYDKAYELIEKTFPFGAHIAEYFRDCRDHRNIMLHPDNWFRADVVPAMSADDILELYDPVVLLYRYLLLGRAGLNYYT